LPLVQLAVVSVKLKVVGSGSVVPAIDFVGVGGSWVKGPPFFERYTLNPVIRLWANVGGVH
jgi:hypothetical protein